MILYICDDEAAFRNQIEGICREIAEKEQIAYQFLGLNIRKGWKGYIGMGSRYINCSAGNLTKQRGI